MIMNKILIACSAMLLSTASYARTQITEDLALSGFFSTAVSKSNNSTPLFVNRNITDDICYDCDTTFGLQVDLAVLSDLDASVQIVKRPHDTWSSPELEWAYISYQYENINIKAGRLRLPLFLSSEYFYVGQAYLPTRLPQTIYDSVLGITSYEGLSVALDYEINDELYLTITPFYGLNRKAKASVPPLKYAFDTEDTSGINAELSGLNYKVMFNFHHVKYETTLTAPTHQMVVPFDYLNMYTLGGEYAFDDWSVQSEVLVDEMHVNWYSMLSHNLGDFTPYVSYAEAHHNQKSTSIVTGVRYDITPYLSANLEWQHERANSNSRGQFATELSDNQANIYTLMLNAIF